MKKGLKLFLSGAFIVGSMMLAGCNGGQAAPVQIEKVTNFKINAETGEFSFTGVKEAKTYYVRVYNHKETKTNDAGEEVEVPLEDKVPVAARRVRFKEDVTEYSGELDFTSLVAGNDYDAYVYTYVKTNSGDLEFAYNDATAFVFKKKYPTPTFTFKKASSSSGQTTYTDAYLLDAAVDESGKLSITLGDNFFAFCEEYTQRSPNYQITIYDAQKTKIDSKVLSEEDVELVVTETENSCGQIERTETRSAVAEFTREGGYNMDDFKISVKIVSTDSKAFYDSDESEITTLKDVVAPAQGGGQGGGEGGPGGGGFPGGGEGEPGGGGFPGGEGEPGGGGFPGGE